MKSTLQREVGNWRSTPRKSSANTEHSRDNVSLCEIIRKGCDYLNIPMPIGVKIRVAHRK
ncbi:hypothetical protein H8356DRAFT_1363129 [Neocallimastix lanati (nom. inval.)]|nr:hypothetical protein H8356DRAFT_1363129 [Neocallimastix sp. JGI-2020a]